MKRHSVSASWLMPPCHDCAAISKSRRGFRRMLAHLSMVPLICLSLGMKSVLSMNLGGVEVPKEKMIVYIMIGHSNMAGRTPEMDTSAHPRAWNFFITDCCQNFPNHTWIPARDCIHKDFGGSGGGPCMHFLKKMVNEFPDYYFGVVENGNSGVSCRANYLKGNQAGDLDLFSEMVSALNVIKESVTFGGIICMLGVPEAVLAPDSVCRKFSADIALMVRQFRDTLGLPNLPFLIGGFERDGPEVRNQGRFWAIIDSEINLTPSVVPVSEVIPSDNLTYFDRWHYTYASYEIWTQRAIDIIKERKWLPMKTMIGYRRNRDGDKASISARGGQAVAYNALGRKSRIGITASRHYGYPSLGGRLLGSIFFMPKQKILWGNMSD